MKYDPETNKKVRNASMDLMRSIPRIFEEGIQNLESVGVKDFRLKDRAHTKGERHMHLIGYSYTWKRSMESQFRS